MTSRDLPENRADQAVVRLPTGQFAPGRSGNPGGRPAALTEVRELAREHTPLAIATLVRIAEKGRSEQARIAASTALLDRAWGRPTQPISGDDEMPAVAVSVEDQQRAIEEKRAAARRAVEEAFGRVAEKRADA